jgi:hypothetical protein
VLTKQKKKGNYTVRSHPQSRDRGVLIRVVYRCVMGLQHDIVYIIVYRNVVMFIHDSFVGARFGLPIFLYL